MAMACCSVSGRLASLAIAPLASSSRPTRTSTIRRSCSITSLNSSSSSLFDGKLTAASVKPCRIEGINRRNGVIQASAAEGPIDVAAETPASGEAETNPIASLKSQADLLKKKAKRLELRRKRLVRKRHLRKKGRWPPSKLKKNKNV